MCRFALVVVNFWMCRMSFGTCVTLQKNLENPPYISSVGKPWIHVDLLEGICLPRWYRSFLYLGTQSFQYVSWSQAILSLVHLWSHAQTTSYFPTPNGCAPDFGFPQNPADQKPMLPMNIAVLGHIISHFG